MINKILIMNRLKFFFAFIVTISALTQSIAQGELRIDTRASGGVVICGSQIVFTVTLNNTSTAEIQNAVLFPQMPPGMNYVAGSAQGMTVLVLTPSLSFTIGSMSAGQEKIVTFAASAACELIPYLNQLGTPSLANNKTKVEYQVNGTSKTELEPNGSESYNVLYPQLELFVPDNQKNLAAEYIGVVKNRQIQIRNSGLGYLSSLDFYLKNDTELELQKVELVRPAGNQLLTATATTPLGRKYTITDFSAIGDGDNLFEENEVINLVDAVKVLTEKASIATVYTTRWGCLNTLCNTEDRQATFVVYVEAIGGMPNVTQNYTVISKPDFCNDMPAKYRINITNSGFGNEPAFRDGAFDLEWRIQQWHNRLDNVVDTHHFFIEGNGTQINLDDKVNLTHFDQVVTPGQGQLPYISYNKYYAIRFNNLFLTDPDGIGRGLEDMDNDGYYDDLPVGKTVTIYMELNTLFSGSDNYSDHILIYNPSGSSKRWSGLIGGLNSSYTLTGMNIFSSDKDILGSSDITTTQPENIQFTSKSTFYDYGVNTANGYYHLEVDLPVGVSLLNAMRGNQVLNVTQVGTKATIKGTSYLDEMRDIKISMNVSLNCANFSGSPQGLISTKLFYYFDPACPDVRIKLAETQKVIYLHCETCSGVETTGFKAVRKTLGWVPPPYNSTYMYKDLFGTTSTVGRVTEATPGLRLEAAYPRDEVEFAMTGKVSGAVAQGSLKAKVEYTSPIALNVFEYTSTVLVVNGTPYFMPASFQPDIVNTGQDYTYTFTFPLGSNGLPLQLPTGSTFELKAKYKIPDLETVTKGEHYVRSIRGTFYKPESSIVCLGFGDDFTVLKPDISRLGDNSGLSTHLYADNGLFIGLYTFSMANGSIEYPDFPNEFRPLFNITNYTATLPKGFIFDVSQPINFWAGGAGYSLTSPILSQDRRTVTIPAENMPLANRGYAFNVYAKINIDCSNPANLYEPVLTSGSSEDIRPFTSSNGYASYVYLPDAALHVSFTPHVKNNQIYNANRSNLQLTMNREQEGYSELVKWPMQICNPFAVGRIDAKNTWVAVELKADDQSTILAGAKDGNGNPLPVVFYGPKDALHPNGRFMLVKMGTVAVANCETLTIEANYRNCQDDVVQELLTYSSWDRNSYPNLTGYEGSVKDRKPSCEGYLNSDKLFLKYKTGALQWTVAKNGPEQVDLCVPVPFEIDLVSTKYADMHNLKVWVDLPQNALVDDANPGTYSYPIGSTPVPIPASAWLNVNGRKGIDVQALIGGNLPGIRLPNNKIKINLSITTSCGFDPGLPIKYTVNGVTNCGDPVAYVDQRKIKLFGITLDELELTLNPANPQMKCQEENDLTLTMKNNGSEPSTPNRLEITLPAGVEFRQVDHSDLPVPGQVVDSNNRIVLSWSLPDGYLVVGQSKTVSIKTYLRQTTNGVNEALFVARTLKGGDVTCSQSGAICPTLGTTGLHELSLPISGLNSLDFTYARYLCAYKFNSLIVESGDCAITSQEWDFGDGVKSADINPLHAFSRAGTYTVKLLVNFTCGPCGGSQTKEKQVTIVADGAAPLEFVNIEVQTDEEKQVISASASTFSDSWSLPHDQEALRNKSSYLNGSQGVWRNDASYVYDVPRQLSATANLSKDGTYMLNRFDWNSAKFNVVPDWIQANSMTRYSPYSYELENRDVLGVYSAALYDYGGHLPSANGVNMRNREMAFTSFEFLDGRVTGNWIFGSQPQPTTVVYKVPSAISNAVVVEASLTELSLVDRVDVTAEQLVIRFPGLPFLNSKSTSYLEDVEIVCKQAHPTNPKWSVVVLGRAPFEWIWTGQITVKKQATPAVNPELENTIAHSGRSSLKITAEKTFTQSLLQLDSGKSYWINAWVSVNNPNLPTPAMANNLGVELIIKNSQQQISATFSFQPSGTVVEGWQQIKGTFICSIKTPIIELKFKPGSTGQAWYDDLRLQPENGNMKAYVYNLSDYRLRAILDEENFASFFYYDAEGNLYLTKKETAKGIKTITENVSYQVER
jgi:uncharacterized repeat protein (TIGR01451 family)